MRSFLLGVASALLSVGIAFVVVRRFVSKGEVVPPQSVRIGLVVDMPCEEHGMDKATVDKTEIVRFYHVVGNHGEEMNVDQDMLLRALQELGVSPK